MTEEQVPVLLRAFPRVLAVALGAVVLAACATGPLPPDRTTGPAQAASAPAAPPTAPPTDGGTDGVFAGPVVPVDPAAAAPAAVALVAAYARPDLDADTWLAGVTPLLSPTAADAVVGTDPLLVPATVVTGGPEQLPSPSPLLALVDVPTDAGPCRVLLSWDEVAGTWLGERVTWTASP